ncbi:primosomal replication protein PriC [Vibrio sp. TH_r3]|uniref:primosomal replication protein PriC n=1 Tax=Vibrio sp. TH_r3 TaxID=3082084 RepID=UPI0029559F9C|nr:primosomal replication protein PriC [Vibrio sp. TH_r3]MDV7103912.1 primosomal replication protein PriC [Vibrio sp. TH_r3]
MNRFKSIKKQLRHLAQRASELDTKREQQRAYHAQHGGQPRYDQSISHQSRYGQPGKNRLFDHQLFKCNSHLLLPYVDEAIQTFKSVMSTISMDNANDSKTCLQQTEFLADKLVNQVNAISRQLTLHSTLTNDIQHQLETLYANLAQHQQWQLRLSDLVGEKKQLICKQPPAVAEGNSSEETLALIAAQQRLARCKQATEKIQQQILLIEQRLSIK